MKKFLLCFVILSLSLFVEAQDTIKVDFSGSLYPSVQYFDFEDNSMNDYFYADTTQANNLWKIGDPIKNVFATGKFSNRALLTDTANPYPANNKSSFYMKLHHESIGWMDVMFSYKLNTDTLTDGGTIEISPDNGSTWFNIAEQSQDPNFQWNFTAFSGGGYQLTDTISSLGEPGMSGTSDWKSAYISVFYSPGCCVPWDFMLRFTFASDHIMNTAKDGWMLDNLWVQANMEGISKNDNVSRVTFYPNPTTHYLSFENLVEPTALVLYNSVGQHALETTVIKNETIDVSGLNPGIYLGVLKNSETYQTTKIIIQ
jgi:hypothetical protein